MPISQAIAVSLHEYPLPLAQLTRRAQNAKTPLERHQAAFYLWEAALKLSVSVAIVEYAHAPEHEPAVTERLRTLVRPSLGQWWEFLRMLAPWLRERSVAGFDKIEDGFLSRSGRDDFPRLAGLDAALRESLEERGGARATVRPAEVWDRLITYRNREIGHGAFGQRRDHVYDRVSEALLLAALELFGRVDPLAGRGLCYVGDVRRQRGGDWEVTLYDLTGESPRRREPWSWSDAETASLPRPETVAFVSPTGEDPESDGTAQSGGSGLRSLHPLLVFDPDADDVLYFNGRRGRKRVEHLSYVSGRTQQSEESSEGCHPLLAELLKLGESETEVESSADASAGVAPPHLSSTLEGDEPRYIGEFELLGKIGVGGMGDVYRAWQPSLGRQVALKCMRRVGDAAAEARFAREIRALGRVEHPHLVKIFTSGSEADRWFYAMELVEGAPLSDVMKHLLDLSADGAIDAQEWQAAVTAARTNVEQREETLSRAEGLSTHHGSHSGEDDGDSSRRSSGRFVEYGARGLQTRRTYVDRVVEIITQVAEATHQLHEAGIVHRDIKPENVTVTPDGAHAVLMDLGLAKFSDEQSETTKTRAFLGTLRYASPEQVLSSKHIDARSDIYSLGVILWELLALQPIYGITSETSDPELMQRIQSRETGSIRRFQRHVPRELDIIVQKSLEKDPDRRYQSSRAFAEDLRRWREGEAIAAKPASRIYRLRKKLKRHRTPLAWAAVALLAGLSVWYWAEHMRVDPYVALRRQEVQRMYERYITTPPQVIDEPFPDREIVADLVMDAPGAYREISRTAIFDLRPWNPVDEARLSELQSPFVLIDRYHIQKLQPIDTLRRDARASVEVFSRCPSHPGRYSVEAVRDPVKVGGTTLQARQLIIDTSDVEVGEEFHVDIHRTYWNGLQTPEDLWCGAIIRDPMLKVSLMVVMPEDRPYTSYQLRVAELDGDELVPYRGEQFIFTDEGRSYIFWEITHPEPQQVYRIDWTWEW